MSAEARRDGFIFLKAPNILLTVTGLKAALTKMYHRAKVPTVSPAKTPRHTFATRALEAGVHPSELADSLGHTTTTILDRYAHATERLRREAMRALEDRELQKALQRAETGRPPAKEA